MNTAKEQETPRFVITGAKIISWVCHPVYLPVVMALLLVGLTPNSFSVIPAKQLQFWLISIFVTGVFFPLVSILLMKQLGFVSSLHMPTARERTIPLMATMIFYFWLSNVFNKMTGANVPLVLKIMLLGNFWGIVLAFMGNIFTKVSLHTCAAGGMIGLFIALMLLNPVNMVVPLAISIIVGGLVGSSRLALGAHQRGDVWLGFIIGIVAQLAAYLYMRYHG